MFDRIQIKKALLSIPWVEKYYINKKVNAGVFIPKNKLGENLNKAEIVKINPSDIKVGLVKDGIEMGEFIDNRSYYPKYERFLKNNSIKYEYYDIYKSDWLDKGKDFDIIIWHTDSDPVTQDIATNKIYVLEKLMKKKCLPSFHEIWTYEDKINAHYLYKYFKLPAIPTFVTHSKEEALEYIEKTEFPIISKIATGSGSQGVVKIKNKKQAKKIINHAFSLKGAKTYFPFQRQKNYVLFQEFIEDATFDLRVIVIGNKLFGYYRFPNKGDFRASGAGNYKKKEIPVEALDLAYQVKELFHARFLATDFLYSNNRKKFLIIESSIFIGVDTCEQLVVNGKPGYYERIKESEYVFKEGRYWIQELTIKELLEGES